MDSPCPRCAGKLVLFYSRKTHTFTRTCFRCGGTWRMTGEGETGVPASSRTTVGAAFR